MTTIGIIGSGLTAISVAGKLIERGCHPVILDVGKTLEPERQQVVQRLKQQPPSSWDAADVAEMTENPTALDSRPKKLAFGSDYAYAAQPDAPPLVAPPWGPNPSFARGGFSAVWGAAMLPADDCDLADWPVRRADLEPYYRQLLERLPLSAAEDPLSRSFPVYKSDPQAIDLATGARAFLDSLLKSRSLMHREDVLFGQARLAVRRSDDAQGAGCAYCGRCMSGCVYGSIYKADEDLTRYERAGQVDYRPGHLVRRLEEHQDKVKVICDVADHGQREVLLDLVFLAAGAINSTRIVLESRQIFNRAVMMKSTQGFVLPMLRLKGASFDWPNTNTLAAAFVEFKVPNVSDHWVHAQISAPNEVVMSRLDFQPHRGRLRDHALKPAFKRLLVALCNFHSDHAGVHQLTLQPPENGAPSRLKIESQPSHTFPRVGRRGARQLFRILARVKVVPLLPFIQGNYKEPWGWHFGGTLPMSSHPNHSLETDVLGRPTGWHRVHVVDSSVFPSIPGTTVGLLAMANARRIADAAPLD